MYIVHSLSPICPSISWIPSLSIFQMWIGPNSETTWRKVTSICVPQMSRLQTRPQPFRLDLIFPREKDFWELKIVNVRICAITLSPRKNIPPACGWRRIIIERGEAELSALTNRNIVGIFPDNVWKIDSRVIWSSKAPHVALSIRQGRKFPFAINSLLARLGSARRGMTLR